MFSLLAQDTSTLPIQGPAWVVGACAIIGALVYAIKTILELRWNVGSKAIIAEREASVKEKELAVREKELDVQEISEAYEKRIKEVETANEKRVAELQAHVDIVDKKLDAAEQRERECLQKYANLEGRFQIIEQLYKVGNKIDRVAENQATIAESVDPELKDKLK